MWVQVAVALGVICVGVAFIAQRIAIDRAIDRERERLSGVATLAAINFRRQVDTFALVATALSADPEVANVLQARDPAATARLNDRLATLSDRLDTSVIYLMNLGGDTIASSNWNQPDSFLGENYRFRGYFTQSMKEGSANQFAMGTRSRVPGLYLGRRIDGPAGPIGVLVVKVRFDRLESEWARSIGEAFVTDRNGVIIVTSQRALRFLAVSPIPAQRRAALRASQAYGDEPLSLHPAFAANEVLAEGRWQGQPFLSMTTPTSDNRTLTVVEPIRSLVVSARNLAWLVTALLAIASITVALAFAVRRRAQAARLQAIEQAEAAALKERFEQANRLSSLGQVAAGVGHEINQPLAAIGVRAGNAVRLLDLGRADEARDAVREIDGLVARAGAITGELRQFARRSDRALGSVRLAAVFEGLAILMSDAIRQRGGELEIALDEPETAVIAEQTRLEQVLVNLVQNALDAGGDGTRISIAVASRDERVAIRVCDDGPGISPAVKRTLFQPFNSSKSHGLGLGLVISRDIVAEFGGELLLDADTSGGACFLIDLRRG